MKSQEKHLGEIHRSFNCLFSKSVLRNRYYLVRHGHSKSNEKNIIISNPVNGIKDFGLTDLGKKEVRNSALSIKNQIHDNDSLNIFSSPFLRTIESSQILSEVMDIKEIHRDVRLRERLFGDLEFGNSINYAKVWEKDFKDPFHSDWNVERVVAVMKRSTSLVIELEKNFSDSTIFLVTHCDVAMILMAGAMKVNPKTHRHLDPLKTGEIRELHFAK